MYKNSSTTIYPNYSDPNLIPVFNELMDSPSLLNFGRLGGLEFDFASLQRYKPRWFEDEALYKRINYLAKNCPGYFDFEDKTENFILYIKKIITHYRDVDAATYANESLILLIEGEDNLERFQSRPDWVQQSKFLLDYTISNKTIINYGFIETVMPFLNSFKTWGEGKRILIISPFSKSLQYQFQRKDRLIKDYTFPNFELLTYNSNLTWQHPEDTKEKLGLKTNNWHEECERMYSDIYKLKFDIAFLSCGCYGLPLGYFIKHEMKKKSIYIGGALNMLFAIYGDRYSAPNFVKCYNPDCLLDPFENEKVKKMTAGRIEPSEGALAYFGHQRKKFKWKSEI